MKTQAELLELYAEAYKNRSITGIKDYISPIIQYLISGYPLRLMVKSHFLTYLQDKFDGQNEQIPIENECISIVLNKTTGKENIFIDFGKK